MIGLACLLLATKIEGTSFPRLGIHFQKNDLLAMEVRVATKLNYFLNPRTYCDHLEGYMLQWDTFIE